MGKQKYRIGIILLILLLALSLNAFALEGDGVALDINSVNNDVAELGTADYSDEVLPVDASEEEPVIDGNEEDIALEKNESPDDVLMAGDTNEQSVQVNCENSITLEKGDSLKVNSVGTIFFTDVSTSNEDAVYITNQTSTSFNIHGSKVGSATITVTGDNNTTTTIAVTVIPLQIKLYYNEYEMGLYSAAKFSEKTSVGIASVTSSDNSIVKPYDVQEHVSSSIKYGRFSLAAVGTGTATVTVKGDNGSTCLLVVTVKDLRYLDCPESILVKKGEFKIASAIKAGTVESSDPTVVKFVQANVVNGELQFEALKEGNATISVHYPLDFGEIIIETDVTVRTPDLKYSRSSNITVQEGSDPVRVAVEEDLTSYYQPTKDYQLISNVTITGTAGITINYWGFMFDIEPEGAGKATVTIIEKTGKKKVFNVTVTAKPAAPPVIKDREVWSISTIYRNTTKVKVTVKNVKKGDVLKLKVGKKTYKKKITSDAASRKITIKIKKPKKYGQRVKAWLVTNKGKFYFDDQEDEAYVYYGKKIRKGLTKKQVKWTYNWGSPSDTATASGGRTYWYYDDGSSILFIKGKVRTWYDAGGF